MSFVSSLFQLKIQITLNLWKNKLKLLSYTAISWPTCAPNDANSICLHQGSFLLVYCDKYFNRSRG